MCIAIPSKIVNIENDIGTIDVEGIKRKVSLQLLDDANVGDYVIVHAGFAIDKIDELEARRSLKTIREVASLMDNETDSDSN